MVGMASETGDGTGDAAGVTIITGFLGSGKSKLIRRVLNENHGLRTVIVENEFGASSAVESAVVTRGLGPRRWRTLLNCRTAACAALRSRT